MRRGYTPSILVCLLSFAAFMTAPAAVRPGSVATRQAATRQEDRRSQDHRTAAALPAARAEGVLPRPVLVAPRAPLTPEPPPPSSQSGPAPVPSRAGAAPSGGAPPRGAEPPAPPEWLDRVAEDIARAEYAFSPAPDGSWSAPNRAHDLRTRIADGAVEIVSRTRGGNEASGGWRLVLRLAATGRDGAGPGFEAAEPADIDVSRAPETALRSRAPEPAAGASSAEPPGATILLRRRSLTEWYSNGAQGLEQGFTVQAPPPAAASAGASPSGSAAGERSGDREGAGRTGDPGGALVIDMAFSGGLAAFPTEDGRAVVFRTGDGRPAVRYSDLEVVDALGNALEATLSVLPGRLRIRIRDDGAVYPLTVDPLIASPAWTAESNQGAAQLGTWLAAAGDVNGDGFSDVIVGAPFYDNGQTDEGRAFLYLGSAAGPATSPAWFAEADQASAQLGASVAAAGDVDGDGFDDLIVGSPLYDNGQTDEGRAFVWLGSASGPGANGNPSNADWFAESDQASAHLGAVVASAGDVDGDGFDDVLAGASLYDAGQTDEGRVFVWNGSASGLGATGTPANADWLAESNQASAHLGASASGAGDVNADGFADVVAGAPQYDNGQTDEGRAFLWLGSASGLGANGTPANADWIAESNQSSAQFGASLAGAGDVNGDGFGDVVVGAYAYDNGETDEGRVFLFPGSASGVATTASWTAESDQAGAQIGFSVAAAGDVNGDGYGDVVAGANQYDNGQRNEGRVYVFEGSAAGLAAAPVFIFESGQRDAFLGQTVAGAGDVDGDGYGDVLAGAPQYDNGQSDEGRAFLFRGQSSALSTVSPWNPEGGQSLAQLGYALSSAGDVNGDGFGDVILGAPFYDNGQSEEGRALVFLGSPAGLSPTPAWIAESDQAGARMGFSVASSGDVNGDGYSDVIVGAYQYDNGQSDEGRAFVWLGSAAGLGPDGNPSNADWFAESNQNGAQMGSSVAGAGDVNGDGYGDVIVAAFSYDNGQIDEGRIFVWMGSGVGLGANGTPANADWFAESNQVSAILGSPVASAGDVNGDGFSDVIAGAYLYDNVLNNEGGAFAWYGSASGLGPNGTPANADWIGEGNQADALFGFPLASAGDVNGDGYSDVVVGATAYDNGDTDEGSAFLYLGSPGGLASVSSWSAESDQVASAFGYVRASAGDVNGDGYSDIIIGAPYFDNGLLDRGRAYLYMGSASGPAASPAWILEGPQVGGLLGYSSGGAGDVNGDGFADVIVSTYVYDNVETNEGRVQLFLGNGGPGAERSPRQARTDDVAPIDVLGKSDSQTEVRLKGLGRTAAGRGRVRLQWEVKPLGAAFDGTGTGQSQAVDTGAPTASGSAVPLSELVDSLTLATHYHWRLRFRSESPLFPRSPWFTLASNALGESDFRTADCVDRDGDGYGSPGNPACPAGAALDCDDTTIAAHPGAPELCDALDNNCDATVDGFGTACGVGACASTGTCQAGVDSCTPGSPSSEICDNIDNNCDGTVDGFGTACGVGACARTGTCAAGHDSCVPGPPGSESCNGSDDDCDGTIDDGVLLTFYLDGDGDGHGDPNQSVLGCSPPPGYAPLSGDCDNTNPQLWGAPGEAVSLQITHDQPSGVSLLSWSPPSALGGVPSSVRYDTLRSVAGGDFVSQTDCLESSGADTSAPDSSAPPPPGSAFYYLVRARNRCPQGTGVGTLGHTSAGTERVGRECVPPCEFNGAVGIDPPSSPPDLDAAPRTITVTAAGSDTFASAHLVITKTGGATDLDITQNLSGTVWTFSWTPGQGAGAYVATATVVNTEGCPGGATRSWNVVPTPCAACADIVAADPNPTGGGNRYYRQQNQINNACPYALTIPGVSIRARSVCATCATPLKLLKVQYIQSGTFPSETANVVYTAPGTGDNVSTTQTDVITFATPLDLPANSAAAKMRLIFSTATPIWEGTSASQKSVLEGDFSFAQASGYCAPSALTNRKLEITP